MKSNKSYNAKDRWKNPMDEIGSQVTFFSVTLHFPRNVIEVDNIFCIFISHGKRYRGEYVKVMKQNFETIQAIGLLQVNTYGNAGLVFR